MLRMQAPEGLSSFSHEGYPFEINAEGVVLIDPRHRAAFESHGFVPWKAGSPRPPLLGHPPIAAMPQDELLPSSGINDPKRSDLIKAILADSLARMSHVPTEDLERYMQDAKAAPKSPDIPQAAPPAPAEPDQGEIIPATGKLTDDQIERMTKPQMVAWCKEREIPVVPPIDADMLRAKVRHANQG